MRGLPYGGLCRIEGMCRGRKNRPQMGPGPPGRRLESRDSARIFADLVLGEVMNVIAKVMKGKIKYF